MKTRSIINAIEPVSLFIFSYMINMFIITKDSLVSTKNGGEFKALRQTDLRTEGKTDRHKQTNRQTNTVNPKNIFF